ncbi:exosome complex exonuclease RRP6 [Apostasia shenzhenica]|uniref:Exosome complex exonuclease RRP6 n=1 Tax=Apostasia shenzhenica TaxID=1088818 RepID=A0A2I0AQM2_9ASPA|nr:exosome complex exonuclease RRP6 [Apostasia shenzhenica]
METGLPPAESVEQKAEALRTLISGPLSSSASRLLSRSRGIPSGTDFHFYNNFDEFKNPVREIAAKAESSLRAMASSSSLWGSKKSPPLPDDLDDAYDWLVNLNDDLLEKFGISMDEFRSSREKQEENGRTVVDSGGGFQLVCGKKKRQSFMHNLERDEGLSASSGIKMASRDKKTTAAPSKVPFHLRNIPRPQNEFNILVNNKNQPFEHVWLERSEDGSFVHPLEKLSVIDFVDRNIKEDEIVKPLPLDSTPFKLVEGVKELKEVVAKLRAASEFAVDLEHNQYRSFLGLTCLMQISTRDEDFILDTLKLRVHIGPYLREVFKDPTKRKVMHGADHDILWLQRDFGIYVCNLFDTGQASRLLQLERNSLKHLLHHFCDVQANKEYQNADWRLRPLPDEMIKYAREDTHYLLHIYDLMRCKLLSVSSDENDLLLEVYQRSSDICMQLYEKELLTDTSYLRIYGLSDADFNAKQLAIVAALCEWRDMVGREEDESTGYILPNKALLKIASAMPISSGGLRHLVKSKYQYVERNLNVVVNIIRNAMANSYAFESVAEDLRMVRNEASAMQNSELNQRSELVARTSDIMDVANAEIEDRSNLHLIQKTEHVAVSASAVDSTAIPATASVGRYKEVDEIQRNSLLKTTFLSNNSNAGRTVKEGSVGGSVQVMKKPACSFGALFGNSSRRKTNTLEENGTEQVKLQNKVEQIKASVTLPFYAFSSSLNPSEPIPVEHAEPPPPVQSPEQPSKRTPFEEIVPLESRSDGSESPGGSPMNIEGQALLSDLSSGFEQCFQSISEIRSSRTNRRPPQEPQQNPQVIPFDYTAARKTVKFGEDGEEDGGEDGESRMDLSKSRGPSKGAVSSKSNGERLERGRQPLRRQAFPPSGNRSTTYRC